jgi:hypothetical protein
VHKGHKAWLSNQFLQNGRPDIFPFSRVSYFSYQLWIVIHYQIEFRPCKESSVVFWQTAITVVEEWRVHPGERTVVFEATTDIF